MNSSKLLTTLEKEKIVRQKKLEKDKDNIKNYSWVLFFAGEEFNQELAGNQEIQPKINLIDFAEAGGKEGKWIEEKIKEFCNKTENKQLIEKKEYPIIWFKNIEKIKSGSSLEKALLPIFDPYQNTKSFSEEINLSDYILLATSSTRDMGQLSAPLTNRLDCINVETAEPKKFFLDKYFNWILAGSILLIITLLLVIFWPNKKNGDEENN